MPTTPQAPIIGGGTKKVLYTLNTIKRIGLLKSGKALNSKNACKACGLGMGGQHGGMTNEKHEFPSVCNKSVQAQSTDIQPPIPQELFEHHIDEFKKLSAKEIESLGRLNTPIYKAEGSDHYAPITWDEALDIAAAGFKQAPADESFFYSSGRSSNEAGFVLQLLARMYGTNNVSNCSFYCHQATGVGLGNTIGSGTATVELDDLAKCDTVVLIGANPASNHPRFIHQLKNLRDRGGKVVVINPAKEPGLVKFAVPKSPASLLRGGDEIASEYLQLKIGSDAVLLAALAKSVIASGAVDNEYIAQFTADFTIYQEHIDALSWEQIEQRTGLSQTSIEQVAAVYAQSDKTVFAWGMGITHHLNGVDNVEAISNLALLRGMIGKSGAGLLPLRGHSNVQGIGTIGVKPVLTAEVMDSIETKLGVKLPTKQGKDTMACLQAAHAGEMKAALLMGGNLFAGSPNTSWTEEAFNRIPFKLYLTTTLNKGHVSGVDAGASLVLPVTARDEEWEPTTQESMFNYVRLSDGGIERLDNVRPESHVLCELGKRLIDNSPIDFEAFKKHQSIRETIAEVVPGMENLRDISVAKQEFHVQNRLLHKPEFHTASKRAHFRVSEAVDVDLGAAQHQDYPMQLMSIRSEGQFNSIIYEEHDSYRGTLERWSVLLNPADMQCQGIQRGDKVTLESPHGEMRDVKAYPFEIPVGNVMAYYPEANCLIGLDVDPRSRTPAFKNVAVRLVVT